MCAAAYSKLTILPLGTWFRTRAHTDGGLQGFQIAGLRQHFVQRDARREAEAVAQRHQKGQWRILLEDQAVGFGYDYCYYYYY